MEGRAAPFVQVVNTGPRTHQSKQALVVTVGSSVVQRRPKENEEKKVGFQFTFDSGSISDFKNYKPAKAVLPVEVCPSVEKKIQAFQISTKQSLTLRNKNSTLFQIEASLTHRVLTLRQLQRVNRSFQNHQEYQYQSLHRIKKYEQNL